MTKTDAIKKWLKSPAAHLTATHAGCSPLVAREVCAALSDALLPESTPSVSEGDPNPYASMRRRDAAFVREEEAKSSCFCDSFGICWHCLAEGKDGRPRPSEASTRPDWDRELARVPWPSSPSALARMLQEAYERGQRSETALVQALQRILRESSDGEAMAIAANALGVTLDRTEG